MHRYISHTARYSGAFACLTTVYGEIQNKVVVNLTGGQTASDTLKNNAQLNIGGTAQLTLVKKVGNQATVNLVEAGTLVLGGHDIFGNVSFAVMSKDSPH